MQTLILFAKYPAPGLSKTRLIPALGAAGAAALHRRMCEVVIRELRVLPCAFELHYTGASIHAMRSWLGDDMVLKAQQGEDLGARMHNAFVAAQSQGSQKTIIVGSDCIELRAQCVQDAFEQLDRAPVVIGPASDGGYYLIGMRAPEKRLFEGISWGSNQVLAQTLTQCRAHDIQPSFCRERRDVDRPEDLQWLGDVAPDLLRPCLTG